MRIYCFEIDDGLDWPTGTAVTARDRRTSSPVLLYRHLDREPDTTPGNFHDNLESRRHTRAILDALPTPHRVPGQTLPLVECFSHHDFVAIAATDAAAAAPALEKLRASGLFLEPKAPPPPPPPPPTVCSRCRQARPLVDGICIPCTQVLTPGPPQSRRGKWWPTLFILAVLIAGALYLGSLRSTPQPAPTPAPVVQFAANQTKVQRGSRIVLSWNTSGLSSVSISPRIGPVPPSGQRSLVIEHDTTFSLSASGPGFTSPVTVSVAVAKREPPVSTQPAIVEHPEPEPPKPLPQPPKRATVPESQSPQTIREALDLWAAAYRANDPQRQAALYAARVDRFFLKENVENSFVLNYMITFYGRGSRFTAFSFSTPDITFDDPNNVKVLFTKHYTIQLANGELRYVNSRSEIHLTHVLGLWKITFERDFKD